MSQHTTTDNSLFTLTLQTSAGPGSAASDNASASQSGPEDSQQAAHREPLKLCQETAEDVTRADGLSACLQDQPPGPAVHPYNEAELDAVVMFTEPMHLLSTCSTRHV